jgi:KDO2-lipid IV(A) lauroyltransferase
MDLAFYIVVRLLLGLIRFIPLPAVARAGRLGGTVFYWLDFRHRRVALENLRLAFGPEKSEPERRAIARENFRRIGESFASAAKTSMMSDDELRPHLEVVGTEEMRRAMAGRDKGSCIVAVGHFGNFELYARIRPLFPNIECATTYRGLDHPRLDGLLRQLRDSSGCRYYERRREGGALRQALQGEPLVLGLLVDQNAGRHGVLAPFFDRPCSTSTAPALFTLRYNAHLFTGICYRTQLAKWRIEFKGPVPTSADGQPRSVEDIMTDVNRQFESAIRTDPANWFWVHRRWKFDPAKSRRVHSKSVVP